MSDVEANLQAAPLVWRLAIALTAGTALGGPIDIAKELELALGPEFFPSQDLRIFQKESEKLDEVTIIGSVTSKGL